MCLPFALAPLLGDERQDFPQLRDYRRFHPRGSFCPVVHGEITCDPKVPLPLSARVGYVSPNIASRPLSSLLVIGSPVSLPAQSYEVELADDDEVEEESMAWQKEFIDLLGNEADSYSDTFNIVYQADRSVDDALGESLTGEIPIAITACASMAERL